MLFTAKPDKKVQGFLLKLVNNHCEGMEHCFDGPRTDNRVRLCVVVLVIPMRGKRLDIARTFAAVTKEFSTTGLSLVLDHTRPLDEVVLGFRWESEMRFVRATVKHLDPMGAGFHSVGMQLSEVLHISDYPELANLRF